MKKKTPSHTFTIPAKEFDMISEIQSRCRKHDLSLNDSEIVRAGFVALMHLADKQFIQAVKSIVRLKRGRQKEDSK